MPPKKTQPPIDSTLPPGPSIQKKPVIGTFSNIKPGALEELSKWIRQVPEEEISEDDKGYLGVVVSVGLERFPPAGQQESLVPTADVTSVGQQEMPVTDPTGGESSNSVLSARSMRDSDFIDDTGVVDERPNAAYDPNNDPCLQPSLTTSGVSDDDNKAIAPVIAHIQSWNGLDISVDVEASLKDVCVKEYTPKALRDRFEYLTTSKLSIMFIEMMMIMMCLGREDHYRLTRAERKWISAYHIHKALPLALFDKPALLTNLNAASIILLKNWIIGLNGNYDEFPVFRCAGHFADFFSRMKRRDWKAAQESLAKLQGQR
ncbi:hypothetical protein HDU88_008755 [Geranomyces variabilis]|nr:hypothetical protein HDU88_008755 [Geranomyces variabilis]